MVGSASHFGSEGNYYSYGNKGSYGMIGTSYVGQYAHKSYKDKLKLNKINLECNYHGRNCFKRVRSQY